MSEVLRLCDSTGSGTLSFCEFVAAVLPHTVMDERSCSEVFNVLDLRRYRILQDVFRRHCHSE